MAENYYFNGLFGSMLPNVYINKITLEGKQHSNKLANVNASNNLDLHINEKGILNEEKSSPNAGPSLKVTFDMLLEVSDLGQLIDDVYGGSAYGLGTNAFGLFDNIKVAVLTFRGQKARNLYLNMIDQKTGTPTTEEIITKLEAGEQPSWTLNDNQFSYRSEKVFDTGFEVDMAAGKIIWGGGLINPSSTDPAYSSKRTLNKIKQKFKHVLPGGVIVYKIPIRITQELTGEIFPTDLCAIATCIVDLNFVGDAISKIFKGAPPTGPQGLIASPFTDFIKHGRHATEVIIKGGKIPQKGMIFFISENQEDEAHKKTFGHLKGQLWFGGVHKHGNRYMAGNSHTQALHAYLDYALVDNRRVTDYRQLLVVKKQLLNFQPVSDLIFGGNYVNLQSKVASADFNKLPCFSNLVSSIERGTINNLDNHVKLLFGVDWGKLLKRYSMVPRLLDMLAKKENNVVNNFMSPAGSPITSFRVFRKRLGIPNDTINQNNRELIYDGYPNVWFFKDPLWDQDHNYLGPRPTSALAPLEIAYGNETGNGVNASLRNFTFTDYDFEKIVDGVFQYSVEIELYDPTIDYFLNLYNTLKIGLNSLGPYAALANGGYNKMGQQTINYFDSHTGKFNKAFLEASKPLYRPTKINPAIETIGEIIELMRKGTAAKTFKETKEGNVATSFDASVVSKMIEPENTTPDAINMVYEVLDTITTKIQKFIESFSTTKIPKAQATTSDGQPIMQNFTKAPLGASLPRKIITVVKYFDNPAEVVSTMNGDVGYEYFGDLGVTPNQSINQIGLKVISKEDYITRSEMEANKYFESTNPVQAPFLWDYDNDLYNITLTPNASKGRYFTVPKNFTFLPTYIVDPNTENEHWQVINNIIRYKQNLIGNAQPGQDLVHYGKPANKKPGSKVITDELERILKEYQTLAYGGTYFSHPTIVTLDTNISSLISNTVNNFTDADNLDNPLPNNADASSESQTSTLDSGAKIETTKTPGAYGQERLLLSLICSNSVNLNLSDVKLGSFNPAIKNSAIQSSINSFLQLINISAQAKANYLNETAEPYIKNVPFQILALMYNLFAVQTQLKSAFRYYENGGTPTLYDEGLPAEVVGGGLSDDDTMHTARYGQFWFNHQNLGEVEYLAGYKKTIPIPPKPIWTSGKIEIDDYDPAVQKSVSFNNPGPKYENIYNSFVNAPVWKPLTSAKLENFNLGEAGHLLCRIKKYKTSIFNAKAYDLLDLPIYDEYFLIADNATTLGLNAYIDMEPNNVSKHYQTAIGVSQAGISLSEPGMSELI